MSGYIKKIDALKIGELARRLGAGRITKDDEIDSSVGIVLSKKVSDKVEAGDVLAKIYCSKVIIPSKDVLECFEITDSMAPKPKLILEMIK